MGWHTLSFVFRVISLQIKNGEQTVAIRFTLWQIQRETKYRTRPHPFLHKRFAHTGMMYDSYELST